MDLTGELSFDHADRKEIYEFVEAHGAVPPDAARESLDMGEQDFGHHVAILRRDGVLEEVDGTLRVAFEAGAEEEFQSDSIEFTIRKAREEDLTGLVGAIREAIGDGRHVHAETVADVIEEEGVLWRHNALESRVFFVATVDDEVVGWVHLKHPEIEKLAHTAELTVGVLEAYRNHGLGSHLLHRGLEWAGSRGYEKIYQSLPATNEDAIAFVEERGFHTEAVREDHYRIGDEYVDEMMMAITL
jgi:ribosomal protein S18 acetylase RimI-like enzyme